MWFKNLLLYRFTAPVDLDPENLPQLLRDNEFTPCGRQDTSKYGWVSPMGDLSEELLHAANGCYMFCARREEKVLPAAVIREKLDDRVKTIEHREDRRVHRKEKETLKEEIIFDCLPQAFTRSQRTYGYVDAHNGWLCIDASSYAKAEEWMKLLRDSLGSLPVVPVQVSESPAIIMTSWLRGEPLPEDLELGTECELREQREEGSVVRCKKQELLADEIEPHLNAGKHVVKLALEWDESLQLLLADDLAIKRLKFGEQLVSEAQDSADGDKAAQFDADFALMTATFARFIPQLLSYFGDTRQDPI
ncbi:recombination-associated protein RdgC [Pseudomaricurvus alkylphenolicus]|jgi:recombination associated protein RdgC|uniref:recombination-associated protein RdgC n=1 Tax=Pseudomaricurvus alkylphenolicus TaxID=1306991 RepID=UPI001420580E|nr:recombination-associated protein RdgC [Pseudomaricurvus alkylphenolicus]NIB44021.1 recombination-associated protein RdgC [Pseudomaricurvus alkylphenolicus]